MVATKESRDAAAPQTVEYMEVSRKNGPDKVINGARVEPKRNKKESTSQAPPPDVDPVTQPDQDLQALFINFKNLKQRQATKGVKDKTILAGRLQQRPVELLSV